MGPVVDTKRTRGYPSVVRIRRENPRTQHASGRRRRKESPTRRRRRPRSVLVPKQETQKARPFANEIDHRGGTKLRGRHKLKSATRNAFAVARTTQRADGTSCPRERTVAGSCTSEEGNRRRCESCFF